MKGKMYKIPKTVGSGKTLKSNYTGGKIPVPLKRQDTIADHQPRTDQLAIPLPDKLRGK